MCRRAKAHSPAGALLAMLLLGASAHAQTTLNWDPNGTTAGIGGNGTWDTTSNFWTTGTDGTSGTYQPWVNGDNTAVFRGGNYSVTLGEPITAGDLSTVGANVTMTGGTLTLVGTPTVNLSGFIQLNSALAGTNGLTLSGGSVLALGGSKMLSGGLTINGGQLRIDGSAWSGTGPGVVTVNNGASLFFNGVNNALGSTTAAANLILNPGSQVVNNATQNYDATLNGGTVTFNNSGVWSGTFVLTASTTLNSSGGGTFSGSLADTGANVLGFNQSNPGTVSILSGTNTYSGPTTVVGAIQVSSAGALSPNSNVVLNGAAAGGRLDLAFGDLSINLGTGPGQLQFAASGGFTAVSASRTVSLNGGGPLTWGAGNFVPSGATLTLGSFSNNTLNFQNAIDLGSQQRSVLAVFGSANGHAVMSGVLSGTGGIDLSPFPGSASLIELSAANTYTGVTHLTTNLHLILGSAGALPGGIGASGGQSNLQFNGGTVLLTSASGDFTRSTGTAGSQVQWVANGGFGALGGNRAVNLGGAGATVAWNTNGFVPTGSALLLGSPFADSTIDFQNPIDLNGAARTIRTLNGTATTDAILSGVISGSASLALDGSGEVRLTAQSTFTGTSLIGVPGTGTSSDSLTVFVSQIGNSGVAGNLGAGSTIELRNHAGSLTYTGAGESTDRSITIGQRNGAAMRISSSGTGALTLAGNITKDATVGAGSFNTLDLGGTYSGAANVISGVIGESAGLLVVRVFDVQSTWRLTGANTHGQTQIFNGTLEITNLQNGGIPSSLGDSSSDAGNLQFQGAGTLRYVGTGGSTDRLLQTRVNSRLESSGTGPIAFTSTGLLERSAGDGDYRLILGGTNTGDNIFALTLTNLVPGIAGNVSNFGLSKDGPGLWALTTNNNASPDGYTQNTILTGGALRLDSAGAITGDLGVASNHGATGSAQRSSLIQFNGAPGSGAVLGLTAASGDFTRGLTTAATSFISDNGTTGTIDDDTFVHGVRWTASGGFAAFGGNRVVDIGGAGAGLTWNSGGFVPTGHSLILGYETADSTVDVRNPISLGNAARTVEVHDGTAAVDGILSGVLSSTTAGGGLVKTGAGTLALTATNTYAGATIINAGTLQIGNGGTTGTLGAGNVVDNATLAFMRSDTMVVANAISGIGVVNQSGTGTTILTGGNTYTGTTTINAGTLQIGNGGTTGTLGTGNVVDNGTLTFMRSNTMTVANIIGGSGAVTQAGTGTTILTATNTWTGATTISAGTLQIGSGGTTGTLGTGPIIDNGTLAINRSDTVTLGQTISGTGALLQQGAGTTILTGINTYGGATTITAGTLIVNGNHSAATGQTTVASGGTLGGTGIIGGNVVVANGGTLAPGTSPGTLTINGNLVLNSGSVLAYELGQANVTGGPLNDLVNVGGNLTLAGTLNVTQSAGGSFSVGVYRIFNYGGTLANNGLTLGTVPAGATGLFVQTSVAGQVNLINTGNATLNFWDGAAGPKNNGLIDGGNGAWHVAGADDNWTDASGAINAPHSNGTLAVFQGQAGTVTVDNSLGQVQSAGMQFVVNGYTITGAPLVLVETLAGTGATTIRVGDGTSAGAGTTATIAAVLGGTTRLVKTDLGTLVLSGTNTYTGGTEVQGGTLRISSDANLGAASGGLIFGGGTLQNTAVITTARSITINVGGGTFQTDADLTVSGAIGGAGGLAKTGTATLILVTANAYTGGTTIAAGTLQLGIGGASGSIVGNVVNNSALAFNRSDTFTFTGVISGSGAVNQIGSGTTVLTGDSTYTGGTTITVGTLQLGNGGASGSIVGNAVNNGALAFNRSDTFILGGVISGSGAVRQVGSGTTVLTGDSSYTGGTTIAAGTLQLGNGGTSGSIVGNVANNGALAFNRSDTLTFGSVISGSGVVNQIGSGTTVLTGTNTYGGGTTIQSGTLRISSDANLGAASGSLVFDGGTLQNTAAFTTARGITINVGGGTVRTDADLTVSSAIGGAGGLNKTGGAVLILTEASIYTGGTTIAAGTFQLGNGGTSGSIVGDVVNNGALAFNRSDTFTFGGVIFGGGVVNQIGSGTTVLTGDSIYTGVTTIGAGTLQFGNGGTSGSIVGDVVNDATLAFNRSDTFTFAGVISGSGAVRQIGSGTTVLTANSSYTGITTVASGTLQLGDGGTSGSIAGDAVNNGVLTFNRSDTVTFAGVISGTGVVNQNGTGTTILTAVNPYTGSTNVNAGTLALAAGAALSGPGTVTVAPGATLGGYGSISGTVVNNGTIAVGNTLPVFAGGPTGNFTVLGARTLINNSAVTIGAPGTPVGNTLTTISYVGGVGSTIRINTVLVGDASPSDRLIVDGGTATGNSGLVVTNVGGGGALTLGDGIQVVAGINGATTATGSFTLAVPAVAGPYEYLLFQGGRNGSDLQSWFLRSTIDCALAPNDPACQQTPVPGDTIVPNFRPEVSLYTAIPSMALLYGQALLGTLHQRAGEPSPPRGAAAQMQGRADLGDVSGGQTFSNGWGRILMQHGRQDGGRGGVLGSDGPKYNYDLYALQVGTDVYRKENSDGSRDQGGAYVALGQIAGDVRHFSGAKAGRDTLQAWSAGLYWTHFGAPGWYVDAVAQGTWYDAKSRSSRDVAALKTHGFGLAASLEGGWPIALKAGWTLEPQAQLLWQRIWLNGANDGASTVRFDNVETLTGRLGARLATTWQEPGDGAAADRRSASVWLRLNLWQEFRGKSTTTFSSAAGPVPFRAALDGTSVEVSLGVTAQFTRATSFFVSAGYHAGFDRNAQAYEGRAGLRITW